MIYFYSFCFICGLFIVVRSLFGYEEYKSDSYLDRGLVAILWLNVTLAFLDEILKYINN